jgi:hypothetical protein
VLCPCIGESPGVRPEAHEFRLCTRLLLDVLRFAADGCAPHCMGVGNMQRLDRLRRLLDEILVSAHGDGMTYPFEADGNKYDAIASARRAATG